MRHTENNHVHASDRRLKRSRPGALVLDGVTLVLPPRDFLALHAAAERGEAWAQELHAINRLVMGFGGPLQQVSWVSVYLFLCMLLPQGLGGSYEQGPVMWCMHDGGMRVAFCCGNLSMKKLLRSFPCRTGAHVRRAGLHQLHG